MPSFPATTKSDRRRWLLLVIFVLALAVRWQRAWVTPVVNSDCLRFIAMAQDLPAHPIRTLRADQYHPLQAVAGGAVYLAVFSHVMGNARMAWIAAMQAVGVVAGAAVAVEIFLLARRFGAPAWAATGAAVLWIVGRKTSGYGADGISDMLFLSLLLASILLALQTGLRWHRWKWFVAGMLSGLSYLTRPEGVAAVLIFWGALALYHCRPLARSRDWNWRSRRSPLCAFACAAMMLLGFVVISSPYMMVIGKFTAKKHTVLNDLVWQANHGGGRNISTVTAAPGPADAAAQTPSIGTASGGGAWHAPALRVAAFYPWRPGIWRKIGQEVMETFGWAPCIIMAVVFLLKPVLRGRRRWRGLALCWALLWLAVMVWLLSTAHYLANRHTLVLVVLLDALFAISLAQAARLWGQLRREIGLDPSASGGMYRDRTAIALGGIVCILGCLPGIVSLAYPPQRGLGYLRHAADWIADHGAAGVQVVVPRLDTRLSLVAYYSGHPYLYREFTHVAIPIRQIEHLVGSRRFIVPLLFQGPGRRDFPREIDGLRLVHSRRRAAVFRSRHALQGDLVALYALPGAEVLKKQ